jgi:hypothetical protein
MNSIKKVGYETRTKVTSIDSCIILVELAPIEENKRLKDTPVAMKKINEVKEKDDNERRTE